MKTRLLSHSSHAVHMLASRGSGGAIRRRCFRQLGGRLVVRSVAPTISAASHDVIFFAIAFNSTTSAAEIGRGVSTTQASHHFFQSGQITY
jgi:hypothetical protein